MKEFDTQEMVKLYNDGVSLRKLSEKYGVTIGRLKRTLAKHGIGIRNKSEQQTFDYENGIRKRLTGKKDEATKVKISNTLASYWKNLSLEKRAEFAQKSREAWYNLDIDKVEEMREKAWAALRKTAEQGSRLEHYIVDHLRKDGYEVQTHITNLIPNEKLEVDILIPAYRIAIEVDGPAHFMPIWGEKRLNKTRSADTRKNGLLLGNNYSILRIKCLHTNISEYILRSCYEISKQELENMKVDSTTRLIEREVV